MTLANLAEAYRSCDQPALAAQLCRKAIALAPAFAQAANNLGLALTDLGNDLAATVCARRAAVIHPHDAGFLLNLGIALKSEARFVEAEKALRAGLALRPDDANGHLALATTLLATGSVKAGLAEYEWRHANGNTRYGLLPARRWTGERIDDGKLLAWGDQGVGDEIMFIQYVRHLQDKVSGVVVECDRRLVSIFERSFPGIEFIAKSPNPSPRLFAADIRAQVALCSLPHVLGLDLEDLRSKGAFLDPDPRRLAEMRSSLAALVPSETLRVGIAWRSLRRTTAARRVHTDLLDWGPILTMPGVSFVNLQYGDCAAEIAEAESRFGIEISKLADLDLFDDLEGGFALGACLDLVISTITTAHCMASATGTETWLLQSRIDYMAFGQSGYPSWPKCLGFVRFPHENWTRPIGLAAEALRSRQAAASSMAPAARFHNA